MMKVTFNGTDYELDLDDIDVGEAMTIFRKTGLTLLALEKGMSELNPVALGALYWYMQKRNGVNCDIDRLDFKPIKLFNAIGDAILAEREAKGETEGEAPKET